jgi:hypothetical protein
MGARNRVGIGLSYRPARVGNLRPAMGRGLNFQERSLEWSSQTSKAGRYDNHMPTWFLAPIAGLMLPTQATYAGGINSLESIPGPLKKFYVSE